MGVVIVGSTNALLYHICENLKYLGEDIQMLFLNMGHFWPLLFHFRLFDKQ